MFTLRIKSHSTIFCMAVEPTVSVSSVASRPIAVGHPVEVHARPGVADSEHVDGFGVRIAKRVINLLSVTRLAKQATVLLAQHTITTSTCCSARSPIRAQVPTVSRARKNIASLLAQWEGVRALCRLNLNIRGVHASIDSALDTTSTVQAASSPRIRHPSGCLAGSSVTSLVSGWFQVVRAQAGSGDD